MHERRRWGFLAASAANAGSQPDIDPPSTPAAESFSQSRREKVGGVIGPSPFLSQAKRWVRSEATAAIHCTIRAGERPERGSAVRQSKRRTGQHEITEHWPRVVENAAARSNQGMSAEVICSTLGLAADH